MPYTKAYAGGWQNGSSGSTPIDATSLNVLEAGIETAYNNFQRGATSPTSPSVGHVWYDTATNLLKNWNGSAWVYAVPSGSVVQTVTVRYGSTTTYSSPSSGNGTTVSVLGLTITPRYATSKILCMWTVFFEMHHDNVFLIHKDGVLLTDAYNDSSGNVMYSGAAASPYDTDLASTPQQIPITYVDSTTNSTASRTYAPAVRSSQSGVGFTLYLNRSITSVGFQYEVGLSYGVAMEIAA